MGLTSPPSPVLCSATTATYPSRFPSLVARPPIPCSFPPFVSFLQARQRSGTLALTPGLPGHPVHPFRVADKETSGPPKFPGYPFKHMPPSSTPVVSSALALAHSGLRSSVSLTASAFPPKTGSYPMSTTIQISRLNHAACTLAPPGFGRLLPGLPNFAKQIASRASTPPPDGAWCRGGWRSQPHFCSTLPAKPASIKERHDALSVVNNQPLLRHTIAGSSSLFGWE